MTKGSDRRRWRRLDALLNGAEDPVSVLVRAHIEAAGTSLRRNRRLIEAFDRADPFLVASVRRFFEEEGESLSLGRMQRLLGAQRTRTDRKGRGTVYTPTHIVETICRWTTGLGAEVGGRPLKSWRVLDPSVGAGAFLLGMAEHLHRETGRSPATILADQLYGIDISPDSIETAELLLNLWALSKGEDRPFLTTHLRIGNGLAGEPLHPEFGLQDGFDAVIGNPPYVRIQNVDPKMRARLRETWETARFGNIDLYIPFIELGLREIVETGVVGYIVPRSFTHTEAGRALRELLTRRGSLLRLYDFDAHQVFEGVSTYACLLFLSRQKRDAFAYAKAARGDAVPPTPRFGRIPIARLHPRRWQFITDEVYPIIRALEDAGRPLGRIARIGAGLATLADRCYLLSGEVDAATGDYVKESEAGRFLIEPELTRPIVKASTLKSEEEIRANRRRILFPYRRVEGKHRIVPEDELREAYPNAYAYLRAIRERLDARDRGKPNPVAWYAFGRSQGIDSNFGRKLLTSGLNLRSRFLLCEDEETTFYGGYCVQTEAEDLRVLQRILNSPLLDFYIEQTSRAYQGGYRSYAKAFLSRFGIPGLTDAERAFLLETTDPQELVAFLLRKYRLDLDEHPVLAAFLEASPKLAETLPSYRFEPDSSGWPKNGLDRHENHGD